MDIFFYELAGEFEDLLLSRFTVLVSVAAEPPPRN